MPELLPCPNLDELHQFLLGRLPADQTDRLQDHLTRCAPCLDTIQGLKAEDTLIGAWRAQASATAATDDEQVAALIQKLSGLSRLPDATTAAADSNPASAAVEPREVLAPPQASDEIGRLSHYRILKVLGAGGMGIVFDADDPQLHRHVALKVMKPELAAQSAHRQRFLREAQAMAAIEHDNIVTIHQVGEDRGIPFLAMQLLKGESLEERLRRTEGSSSPGQLSIPDILRIGRETAEGLAAAHVQGLTHRDIKPANIWLEKKSGRVKILDFGLARPEQDDTHLTQTGLIAGTPQYMSPEQAAGQPVDQLSDLFSLGCVLYRLLTGRLPFVGASTLAVLRALALEQPPTPHEIHSEVPPALSELTMRLLAKDPRNRPQSAEAVVAELAEICRSHLPDGTSPDVSGGPARQAGPTWARRRNAVIAATLLLLLAGPPAVWYGPTVYRFATNQGLLVVETDDPAVEVTVKQDGKLIKIVDRKTGQEVTLKAGVYQLELSGDRKHGLKLETDEFTLKRGGRAIARVWREPPAAAATVPAIATEPGFPALPFVVAASGDKAEQKFATLAEAITGAASGDTIEVRGNVLVLREIVRIRDKALTIQAAQGFRPVIQLVTDPGQVGLTQIDTDSPLRLEGLEFHRAGTVPENSVSYWCVWSKGAPLWVAHCRFVLRGPTEAVFFDGSPLGEIRHCEFVLGQRTGCCEWICPSGGRLTLDGNVVAGTASGLILHQRDTDLKDVALVLTHNTLSSAPLQVSLDVAPPAAAKDGAATPIRIEASNNVLASSPVLLFHQGQVLYDPQAKFLTAPAEAEALLRRLVSWSEHHNLYPEAPNFLVVLSHVRELKPLRERKSLAEWKEYWGIAASDSLQGPIRFQRGDAFATLPQAIETVTAQDLRLHPQSPGFKAGEGGRDMGADVDLVGPGPAYERWQATPDYQQWLKDIEQVVANAAPAEKAFVVLAQDDRAEQKFATLAEAVNGAASGDTIEVRRDGPPIASPILIAGKALTIRAAPGTAPTLLLKPATVQDAVPNLQTDSPLTLEGLTFHTIDPSAEQGPYYYWTVIADQAPLRVANCRFAIESARPYGVLTARGSARCELRNCQAHVGADRAFVDWSCPSGGRFVMDNNVVGGPIGHAVVVHHREENLSDVRLTLSHNSTTLTPVLLLLYRPEPATTAREAGPAMRVDAVENVFAGPRVVLSFGQEQAVEIPGAKVHDTGAGAEALLLRLLAWRDERNLYAEGIDFLHLGIGSANRIEPTSVRQSLTEWQRLWGTGDNGSLQGRIRFQSGDLPFKDANSAATLAPQDYRLAPDGVGQGAGKDGRDLGADVDLVGPGPAYEKWRQSPAYQEWLNAARQTP